ncbi:ABC transporter [Spirochaeta lutea]|uniref:ABC transporter n=2 Tax=Spirochaeta lutea TaxID=1480694 RepID=A0A098QU28_9SPIO|nr:ABC transporter [Spirochaeta lutea]
MSDKSDSPVQRILSWVARLVVSFAVPLLVFVVLYFGFLFLRDSNAPQIVITISAIIWGVGGAAALYWVTNWVIQRTNGIWRKRLTPFMFVGPAIAILGWYLMLPTLRSFYLSFFDRVSENFVGLDNYIYVFTDPTMQTAFVNNLLWLVVGTGGSVLLGLIIALLADRSGFEKVAKAFIFAPMAISFVGAGVIWKFIYAYQPPGYEQIGLLNAIVTSFGGDPQNWIVMRPWNNIFLIFILIWLQTGFAMVVLSAAIKTVPNELLEAGRIDGAGEIRIITSIIVPSIKGSIVTVSTTILLITLKIFDIVYSMTNGLYGTEVLASQQYKQMFKFLHYGRGSAIAIIILLAVTPVIWYNLKQFGKREVF